MRQGDWRYGAAVMVLGLALAALALDGERAARAAPAYAPVATRTSNLAGVPTDVVAITPTVPSWASALPLTTTTISLYKGNVCAVWGEAIGSSPTVTVTAGPVLVSYSLFSRYASVPDYEPEYAFALRVGETQADLTLNGQSLTMTYRGELRIEYVPVPVSKRYSYATYGLAQLEPGVYDVQGSWQLANDEKDGPRNCRLVAKP